MPRRVDYWKIKPIHLWKQLRFLLDWEIQKISLGSLRNSSESYHRHIYNFLFFIPFPTSNDSILIKYWTASNTTWSLWVKRRHSRRKYSLGRAVFDFLQSKKSKTALPRKTFRCRRQRNSPKWQSSITLKNNILTILCPSHQGFQSVSSGYMSVSSR